MAKIPRHPASVRGAASDPPEIAMEGAPPRDRRSPSERPDTVWPYLWESQAHNLILRQVAEVVWHDYRVPVWRVIGGAGSMPVFQGMFVRYEDLPEALLKRFLEGQEVPVGPFYGAAYVEDLRLFLELHRDEG